MRPFIMLILLTATIVQNEPFQLISIPFYSITKILYKEALSPPTKEAFWLSVFNSIQDDVYFGRYNKTTITTLGRIREISVYAFYCPVYTA